MSEKPIVVVVAPLHQHKDDEGRSFVLEELEKHFCVLPVEIPGNKCLPDSIPFDRLTDGQKASASLIITDGENGVDGGHMDAFPNISGISNFGAGTNPIDMDAANERELLVGNTPEVLSDAVADMAVTYAGSLLMNTAADMNYLMKGTWEETGTRPPLHSQFAGKRVGIYGMGDIGIAVARRLQAFGVEIRYHNRNRRPDVIDPGANSGDNKKLVSEFTNAVLAGKKDFSKAPVTAAYERSLPELAQNSDILICAAPLTDETRNSINAEVLEGLGNKGYFINVGRGEIHDEKALLDALENGTIRGAALDVHHEEPAVNIEGYRPFVESGSLIATPHTGSRTVETRTQMGRLMAANALAMLASNGKNCYRSPNYQEIEGAGLVSGGHFDVKLPNIAEQAFGLFYGSGNKAPAPGPEKLEC